MKDRYRLVRRGNRFYAVDRQTLTRENLGTNDIEISAVVALGIMTLAVVTLTVVVLFWENGRTATLITVSLFYLLATMGAYRTFARRLHRAKPFSATLVEIEKDKEWLKTKS